MEVEGSTQLAVVKVGECRCFTRAAVCERCKRSGIQTHDTERSMNVGSERQRVHAEERGL